MVTSLRNLAADAIHKHAVVVFNHQLDIVFSDLKFGSGR